MKITEWRDDLFSKTYKEISPLEFGMTYSDITSIFGEPDDTSTENPPLIYKYLDIELHFNKQDSYKLFLVYSDEVEELIIQFEPVLYNQLMELCYKLTNSNEVYCQLFSRGHELLSKYKMTGGSQANAFNTVMHLYLNNRRTGSELTEYREDLISDWLDCMCGWVGNRTVIW